MALVLSKQVFSRATSVNILMGKVVHPAAVGTPLIQVAGMRCTYGEKYPYVEPFDYKNKIFSCITEWFDNTSQRLNENSKFIVVDGPCAVGKNEFAKKIAREFDLHYIPSYKDEQLFKHHGCGWDVRIVNDLLQGTAKFYDLAQFYAESNPYRGLAGRLQLDMYKGRYLSYAEGLEHILHTGQGCVMASSPFSDLAYTEAMRACNYVTKGFLDYYSEVYRDSICELWSPHLAIYLDTPVDTVMANIEKRGDPREQNSKVFTRDYMLALDNAYKTKYLPLIRQTGHVMEIDWATPLDDVEMDAICYEIQSLRMEALDNEDPYFQNWSNHVEDDLCFYRRYFGHRDRLINEWLTRDKPLNAPEICIAQEDFKSYHDNFIQHPGHKYVMGTATQLGHSRWRGESRMFVKGWLDRILRNFFHGGL